MGPKPIKLCEAVVSMTEAVEHRRELNSYRRGLETHLENLRRELGAMEFTMQAMFDCWEKPVEGYRTQGASKAEGRDPLGSKFGDGTRRK
jgi:hypothetical protein